MGKIKKEEKPKFTNPLHNALKGGKRLNSSKDSDLNANKGIVEGINDLSSEDAKQNPDFIGGIILV
ncbi:MAG: hypothetical protein KBD48_03795 [Candidatus Pacebacteria bacterium]|nr:hypothetical protein [Candidatus Paceibacterota bacterium]MBP9716277.1 hypothetical protein [Candidatus Paceibacterota bacterium]